MYLTTAKDSYYNIQQFVRKNARHIALTLSVAVIVYSFLFFVIVQNVIGIRESVYTIVEKQQMTEYKQNAIIIDMKREGIELKHLNSVSGTIE